MNWDDIQSDWKQFGDSIRRKWGRLTRHDVTSVAGRREHLIECIQRKYDYDRSQVESELCEFTETLEPCFSMDQRPDQAPPSVYCQYYY